MVEAIERIEHFTQDVDFEAFAASEMIAHAVLHNIQIVGEAARHIPEDVQAQYPDVDWAGMRGMRNVLVHDYAAVRLDVVWNVVAHRLPPLAPQLREILALERASGTES